MVKKNEQVEGKSGGRGRFSLFNAVTLLIGVGLPIYFYNVSRVEKEPCYTVESTSLVAPSRSGIPGIKILYKEKPVEQVTSTTVHFWNAGKKTIDKTDIAQTDPVRILLPSGTKILSAKVVKFYRPTVAASIKPEGRSAYLSFDFLDRDDGCTVQILHTGRASAKNCKVIGTIKGSGLIRRMSETDVNWQKLIMVSLVGLLSGVIAASINWSSMLSMIFSRFRKRISS